MDGKLDELDRNKRRPNLILYGVPESEINPRMVAKELFTKVKADITDEHLSDAFRMGPKPPPPWLWPYSPPTIDAHSAEACT